MLNVILLNAVFYSSIVLSYDITLWTFNAVALKLTNDQSLVMFILSMCIFIIFTIMKQVIYSIITA